MKRQYTIYNICVLLALLLLPSSWNGAWGQEQGDTEKRTIYEDQECAWTNTDSEKQRIINRADANLVGGGREVIYAQSESELTLSFQDGGSALNLDGYIRWYVITDENDIKNTTAQTVGGLQLPTLDTNHRAYGKILRFQNGIAWLRGTSTEREQTRTYGRGWSDWEDTKVTRGLEDVSPREISNITYQIPDNFGGNDEIIVVCEASSLNNAQKNEDTWTAPMVTFRHVFVIRPASVRSSRLKSLRDNLVSNYSGWTSWRDEDGDGIADAFGRLIAADKSDLFLESYELHTPLKQTDDDTDIGTNYRLDEALSNYFVEVDGGYNDGRTVQANQVQWRIFNEAGRQLSTTKETSSIWKKAFGKAEGISLSATKTQVLYVVAEVACVGGNTPSNVWYPAAFLKIYLEPYSEPLTESDLLAKGDNYGLRKESVLEDNGYKIVESLSFDPANKISIDELRKNPSLNYAEEPMENIDSYYAYAYPGEYQYRRENRYSVGRGEFGLYRTLNYPGISRDHINGGEYTDAFPGRYNVRVVDRLGQRTNGAETGYFFYLDATDDPGVITNIGLPNDLCPDIRLIVTAWVCDFRTNNDRKNNQHADISITFKGKKGDEETILNRYFSGVIPSVPSEYGSYDPNNDEAEWQQIYFSFSFPNADYESYSVEIANNCPRSDGADYAIDDIQIWRSTPNIEVNRREACDASTLTISSDYSTILRNMDWTENEDIADIEHISNDPSLLRYRLGLQGNTTDSDYPIVDKKVGNSYFSFLEGLVQNTAGDWISPATDVTGTNTDEKP